MCYSIAGEEETIQKIIDNAHSSTLHRMKTYEQYQAEVEERAAELATEAGKRHYADSPLAFTMSLRANDNMGVALDRKSRRKIYSY